MSPRPSRLRKVSNPPIISGLKPYGNVKTDKKPEAIFLHFEEYEALRLCDYEMLNHHQASVLMDVSRPTLTRIYSRARNKIAEALVFGKQIIIEGGKIYFDSEWYSCKSCGCYFNNPNKQEEVMECPLCRSKNFSAYDEPEDIVGENVTTPRDMCICPNCGYEMNHSFGIPCKNEICSVCGHFMVRKSALPGRHFNF
jgi:predicted DNA-binding protein (UPF0251 family)